MQIYLRSLSTVSQAMAIVSYINSILTFFTHFQTSYQHSSDTCCNNPLTHLQTLTSLATCINNLYQTPWNNQYPFLTTHTLFNIFRQTPNRMGKDIKPLRQKRTTASKTSCDVAYDINWEIMSSDIAKVGNLYPNSNPHPQ